MFAKVLLTAIRTKWFLKVAQGTAATEKARLPLSTYYALETGATQTLPSDAHF